MVWTCGNDDLHLTDCYPDPGGGGLNPKSPGFPKDLRFLNKPADQSQTAGGFRVPASSSAPGGPDLREIPAKDLTRGEKFISLATAVLVFCVRS
jgi:hypothetical protein